MTERERDLMRRSGLALQIRGLLLELRSIEAKHALRPLPFDRELASAKREKSPS